MINKGAIALVAEEIIRLADKADGWNLRTARGLLVGIGLANMDAIKTKMVHHGSDHEFCIQLEAIDVSAKNQTRPDQLEALFALVSEIAKHRSVRFGVEIKKE